MEKLEEKSDVTLLELLGNFVMPFEPITLVRKLPHYQRSIALQPGIAGLPSPEIWVQLFTGKESHQAAIRNIISNESLFKGFEALTRNRRKVSPKVILDISKALNLPEALLRNLVHGNADGPLLPQLRLLYEFAEGAAFRVGDELTRSEMVCKCCGHVMSIKGDGPLWWGKQAFPLNEAEARFADRLLITALGISLIQALCFKSLDQAQIRHQFPGGLFAGLCDPGKHPIGHWLRAVQIAHRCSTRKDLLAKLQSNMKFNMDIQQLERMNHWACGTESMPLELGFKITENLHCMDVLRWSLHVARTLALVIDFLMAATPNVGPLTRREALKEGQRIVRSRMGYLLFAFSHVQKTRNPRELLSNSNVPNNHER